MKLTQKLVYPVLFVSLLGCKKANKPVSQKPAVEIVDSLEKEKDSLLQLQSKLENEKRVIPVIRSDSERKSFWAKYPK